VKRLNVAALATLVAATIAAFFFVQHLKVTTPFFSGSPRVDPSIINPVEGGVCRDTSGRRVSFRRTQVSFYLVNRAGDVNMNVVNNAAQIVRTVATNRYMPKFTPLHPDRSRRVFTWDGREDSGLLAPDGTYYFQVTLISQDRTIDVGGPITVQTTPTHPDVYYVTPQVVTDGQTVTIHFRGNDGFRSEVLVYRTDLPGPPRLVDKFPTVFHPHGTVTWDGLIDGSPAPAGTYLIGLRTTNKACATTRFPIVLPPPPGTTSHAGVTVRYLAAQPPLVPVAAGSLASVYVDSRGQPYRWALALAGARAVIAHGTGRQFALGVRLPRKAPGLYVLSLQSGAHRTAVPLVASAPRLAHPPRILVVLPALTWQGLNPVDDVGTSIYDGDGLPNTLTAGVPIELNRVLADGLPAGLGDEAGLLTYLDKEHLGYDLTTDLGLIEGVGPALSAYRGVVLAGSERWLPQPLIDALRSYVQHGGNVLSLGIDSLLRGVTVQNGEALHPTAPAAVDALGARPGPLVPHTTQLITVTKDDLGIFTTTPGAIQGYSSYQPFDSVAAEGGPASAAGATTSAPAIVGYRLGNGTVVEIGLVGFGSSLRNNVDAQELISRLWQVLGR
jgi:hypothetical protein